MQASRGLIWAAVLGLGSASLGCGDKGSAGNDKATGGSSATGGGGAGGMSSPAPEPHSYPGDDPKLQYTGRLDLKRPSEPHFASPGVQVKARFRGTGATIKLADENRYGNNKNYFEVIVDGEIMPKLTALKEQTDYVVAKDLPNGEHTVVVSKRTEANVGFSSFLGIDVQGELLDPPARPTRRIEIIGDSISCGSGNEAANNSPQCQEDGWGQPYHNSYLSYGAVMARSLDAEYHITAVSGIGLVRNYSSMYDARPMPEVYDLVYLEQTVSPLYDTSLFVPDAVVVALGTNDFSPGDSEREKMTVETYTEAYVSFVEKLRGYYPQAHIFGMSSPMLGDGWPDPADTFASDLKAAIAGMVDHFNTAGDDKVHAITITKIIGDGCGTHPSAAQHAKMAEEAAAVVKDTLGW